MKTMKFIYIYIIITLFAVCSCESVLDTEAKDAFAEDLIYSNPAQLERLVFTAYNSTDSWCINRSNWWGRHFNIENASYEARFNFKNLDQLRVQAGWTSSNCGVFSNKWSNSWDYVRSCNEFLDRIDACEAMKTSPDEVSVLKAEMRFLRANTYSKLIKYFGGVPIMEHALGLDDDFNLVRNSYEECVDFIVSELDAAAEVLPETRIDAEFGRATKIAALAVKSRTLLYAASALHESGNVPTTNSELYLYSKSTKWQDAADAAKDVIDLYGSRDLIAVKDASDYQSLFLSANEDIIFARPYSSDYYEFGTDVNTLPDMCQTPNGYGGWGLSTPTLNFVMEFNMADGTTTSGESYSADDPNANREMRYYANLNFNGSLFRGREIEYFLSEDNTIVPDGLDSPGGLGNVLHSSKTGYNIRKFQDESLTSLTDISASRPYILYRLAEIYLNYAEAMFHVGQEDVARTYVNKVSSRALQPDITASGDELLEAIKRERRVELCFEGHNFFDERRWMNEAHLGFDVHGLAWTKSLDGTLSHQEYTIMTRPWWDKQYYLPIPSTEVEKAPSILQNDGY